MKLSSLFTRFTIKATHSSAARVWLCVSGKKVVPHTHTRKKDPRMFVEKTSPFPGTIRDHEEDVLNLEQNIYEQKIA